MDLSSVLHGFPSIAWSLGRIIAGVALFAAALPLRDGARWRIPAAILGLMAAYVVLSVLLLMPTREGGLAFSLGQLATYSLLLISCVGAVLAVWDTVVWTALFCCAAGYSVQNLASGATELFYVLQAGGHPGLVGYTSQERLLIEIACTAVTYAAAFALITRPLLRDGLSPTRDRSMLVMMAVVIIVIIGFDLVIKWLTEQGIALGAMMLLRLFHGLACIFTLAMEFELLVRREAEAERDTLRQVIAEHERQYEQARESVAAVNARMHDIRHAVAQLGAAEGMGSEALREMVREIAVYDTTVRTGNEALDTVLSERRFLLEREGVALSCMADGAALSFMAPADIYTLFSAILDGAAAAGTPSISLVIREALGTASIHVECYGGTPDGTWLETGRTVVRRYGGTFSTAAEDGTLHINVLFPAR